MNVNTSDTGVPACLAPSSPGTTLAAASSTMGSVTRRQLSRRKSSGSSCGTSKLTVSKMPTKSAGHVPRWSALPEGPLLRMFEVMAWQDDGRALVSEQVAVSAVASWHETEETLLLPAVVGTSSQFACLLVVERRQACVPLLEGGS